MEHDPYQVLAQRLRRRRTEAGLSLERLGERAGVSGAYISHIEAGRKKPTLYTIERLATALQTKVEDLLGEYGKADGEDNRHLRRFQELTRGLDAAERVEVLGLVERMVRLTRRKKKS